jgi:integrase
VARKPSPWYWPERNGWYTILNGQRHSLGEHPADTPSPQKRKGKWVAPPQIQQAFHTLLATPPASFPVPTASPTNEVVGLAVAEVLDKYLDWCRIHRAAKTHGWYRDHLQSFLDDLQAMGRLPAEQLKPFHVVEWADSHTDWSTSTRRGAILAVQRAYNWAEEMGHVAASPIKRIKKPSAGRRDNPITPEDFAVIVSHIKDQPFRDLLTFAWETGCRPQEARHIEPRHIHVAAECIVIPKEEAKGKKRVRIIYLTPTALQIVRRLLEGRSDGKLFRNADGTPWKKSAICCRFYRLKERLGMKALREAGIPIPPLPRFNFRHFNDPAEMRAARKKHQRKLRERRKQISALARKLGKGWACYDFRHGFTQRLLENGANHLAVAELLGHANGQMVSTVYSHMNRAAAHLKETLKKTAGS